MTTTRIDHAEIARNNMDWVGSRDLTPDAAAVTLAAAQVHATLALVEQQRIANRLKVAELDLTEEIGYRRTGGVALDFRIRPYISSADWASLEVIEDDGTRS